MYWGEITMILMQVNGISKSFAAEEILTNIKLEIKDKERIAIVGRNGAGKSTLLKIMAGELSYDEGEIIKPKETTIGYLAQHTSLDSGKTNWKEMLDVFHELLKQEEQLRRLEKQMETISDDSSVDYEQLLKEYDRLQVNLQTNGG